jgi:hypothetical protein
VLFKAFAKEARKATSMKVIFGILKLKKKRLEARGYDWGAIVYYDTSLLSFALHSLASPVTVAC